MLRWILDAVFPPQCAACNGLGSALCASCAPPAAAFRVAHQSLRVVATGWYDGALRAAVLALKDGRRDVAEALGARIAPAITSGALLVPVPTTRARLRARGADGVALVAETAAWLRDATALRALEHCGGDMQRGRTRTERLAAHDRFRASESLAGRACTLVDDVCTTGSTLTDCALAIGSVGGTVVGAVVVAATKSPTPWL
ncbi:MAG TPA: phosphoribosyltransferase family protein [Candidatus Baltobacteraceae bacterium]|jgi:predicted amidophosphoribosyltransferase|nr:phosphoribosyltransferase family protein [Candidatus Baltobacteraceae bacterium]